MRDAFLRLGSYIFHPLWLSTYTTIYYFLNVSFMFTYENMVAKVLAIILLTIIIPIFFLIILKPLKIISNFYLKNVKERRIPLLLFTTISAIIINYIFDASNYKILFYFFSGVFFCGIISIVLSFINYKISLHAIGISSLTTFIIAFNIYYQINTLWFISLLILSIGWVISSRLFMKSHAVHELITGMLLGIIAQLFFVSFWFW